MHIFVNWGEEKLRGEERLNYLNTYLHCFPLISYFRSLDYILFSSPNQGTYGRDGKVRLAFKSGTKSVDFPSHF